MYFQNLKFHQVLCIECFSLAKSLEVVQHKFNKVEIGSYPFFRLGKIGVSIVVRSTDKKKIDDCNKEIVSFLKKRRINIIGNK